MKEQELQKKIKDFITSNPMKEYELVDGNKIQILSPGSINVHEGPDFLGIAIQKNGNIIVGDCEVHKNSSEWFSHKHQADIRYNNVILHIVLNHNTRKELNHDILVIDEEHLKNILIEERKEIAINEIYDLQEFALIRLLRKSAECQREINRYGLERAIIEIIKEFIIRFSKKRRRNTLNSIEVLEALIHKFKTSDHYNYLIYISDSYVDESLMEFNKLMSKKISNEGKALRYEIIINCILPISICIASKKSRIHFFQWYWSSKAVSDYGILERKFPDLPQEFFWQQQGMLEYLKLHGQRKIISSEKIEEYGILGILNFYKYGKS